MAQITLQGPQNPRAPLNTGDETPETGWWPKRIIDALNTMLAELYASVSGVASSVLGVASGYVLARSSYTVVADDDTAGTVDIDTGLTSIDSAVVQILRGGAVATSDAAVSWAGGIVTVADGSTYTLTADDIINLIAIGA